MMIPAMDSDHRLHRLPFAVQPFSGESNGLGFGRDVSKHIRSASFCSHSHTITFAHPLSKVFDAGQGLDRFIGCAGKHNPLT
jgi:hypothetical protein